MGHDKMNRTVELIEQKPNKGSISDRLQHPSPKSAQLYKSIEMRKVASAAALRAPVHRHEQATSTD